VSDTYTDLLAALVGAPALPGVRCRGRSHLFDERGADESAETAAARHEQAIGLCRLCPSLASCEQWFHDLPESQRPPGVVAARVRSA